MGHSDLYSTAADASRQGLQKVEDAARRGLDQIAEHVDSVRGAAGPMVDRMRSQVSRASDRTVGYVQDAPVRSALVVLAVGTLVYAVARALSRDRY
ncbi:MAG: hypothetical protein EOP35_22865 [Rubrivivax sp.]|nr:MAG: hypothetical protein EOP35_22865 [Rubrivivax sp.]